MRIFAKCFVFLNVGNLFLRVLGRENRSIWQLDWPSTTFRNPFWGGKKNYTFGEALRKNLFCACCKNVKYFLQIFKVLPNLSKIVHTQVNRSSLNSQNKICFLLVLFDEKFSNSLDNQVLSVVHPFFGLYCQFFRGDRPFLRWHLRVLAGTHGFQLVLMVFGWYTVIKLVLLTGNTGLVGDYGILQ